MPHQRHGVEWLKKKGSGVLAWPTGVGKTYGALAFCSEIQTSHVLIVAPVVVLSQWAAEIERFTGSRATVIRGTASARARLWHDDAQFKVVGYEVLRTDYKSALTTAGDVVVFDEAHRLVNTRTKTWKVARKLQYVHRVLLTATPAPNGYHNWFGLIDLIAPGTLGSNYWSFQSRYCVMHPVFRSSIRGYRDKDRLLGIVSRFIHTVDKAAVLPDLPECTETIVPVQLGKEERALYNEARDEMVLSLSTGEDVNIQNALTKLLRLKQITNNMCLFGYDEVVSSKFKAVRALLEDKLLDPSVRAIVFTSFKETAHLLEKYLEEYAPCMLTGGMDEKERAAHLERFKSGGKLLIATEAGGVGIELKEASVVIMVDLPYSWAKYTQRVGRAHRKGQTRGVQVYMLNATDTVDEWTWRLINKKKSMEEEAVSRADIEELLT